MDPITCPDCGRLRQQTLDGCCGLDDCINFLRLMRQRYEAVIHIVSKEVEWLTTQSQASVSIFDSLQSIKDAVDKVKKP